MKFYLAPPPKIPPSLYINIGNDVEREKENRKTDMENEKLKSSIDRFGQNDSCTPTQTLDFLQDTFLHYDNFIAIYNFVKPKPGFILNYYNGCTNKLKDPTYVNARGRQRNLLEIDELLMTLNRHKLGLLEQDLAERFGLKQNVLPQIVCTWIDILDYCLCQLNLKTSHKNMEKHLPACFKGEYKDSGEVRCPACPAEQDI